MHIDVSRELDRVILSDHHDPFQVLGYHVLPHDPDNAIIRAFLPHAESVRLLIGEQRLDMYRMRDEGLFEIVIPAVKGAAPDYMFEVSCYDGLVRELHDPYKHLPLLSEYDRHLFNSGTHYELYNRLGAHPAVSDGIEGTVFRVWAPSARRVSVIGDFNFWDGRVHQMRVLGSAGVWEIF
ncbi:MAG: 1,4-alpha-glucan branching enzyme, partial [Desulfobulbaceae bacterium]|nr:1,4-alpha-glucan branching enzyme [Desulfobulbaceae bacterium]